MNIRRFIYNRFFSLIYTLLSLFLTPDRNQILFTSGSGRTFSGNPRALYEFLSGRSKAVPKCYWMFESPNLAEKYKYLNAVHKYSWKGLITAAKSFCWLFDGLTWDIYSPMVRLRRKQILIQLWHGIGPKKEPPNVGRYRAYKIIRDFRLCDFIITTSHYAVPHYFEIFKIHPSKVLELGYPRHDKLFNAPSFDIESRHTIHGITGAPKNKKWVLWAPTWRETTRNITMGELAEVAKMATSSNAVLFFRAHNLGQPLELPQGVVGLPSNLLPDVTQFLPAFDVLISDYSSIAYDYMILGKPIILYMYDYDEYRRDRGLNFVFPDDYPGLKTFSLNELLDNLQQVLLTEVNPDYRDLLRKFFRYPDGESCLRVAQFIDSLVRSVKQ